MAKPETMSGERQFVRRVLIILALTALFFLAWQLRTLLLMLFGALVVATIFRALADRICRLTGWGNNLGTALSIILVLGVGIALIALFGTHVIQQIQILRETLPAAWHTLEARMGDLGLGEQMKRWAESIRAPGGSSFSAFGRTIL